MTDRQMIEECRCMSRTMTQICLWRIQCQPFDEALDATLTVLRALLVLLHKADSLNAEHDRLTQIAAEPVLPALRTSTIPRMPLRKGVVTIARCAGLLKLNFDLGCHFVLRTTVIVQLVQRLPRSPLFGMLSGNRIDGRPTDKPVLTVALSWAPTQTPTKEQMIEAAQSYLKHMRWDEHQCLLVAHNDTKHPHVHLILNTVHPETGMALDASWTKTRSHQWSLKYEREHGEVLCAAREGKYEQRFDLAKERGQHMSRAEWRQWQEISKENAFDPEYRHALEAGEWQALRDGQKAERVAFWKEAGHMRKDLRAAVRAEVREEFKKEWAAYNVLKAERADKARAYDQQARRAVKHCSRLHGANAGVRVRKTDVRSRVKGQDGRGEWQGGQAVTSIAKIKKQQKAYHATMRDELTGLRADIFSRQKARFEELATPALEKLGKDRLEAYDEFKARHRAEKGELHRDQAAGDRRRDVLGGLTPANQNQGSALTPEQAAAYIAQARETAKQHGQFNRAGDQVTTPDLRRAEDPPARDPREQTRDRKQDHAL
jgi:Relaxase/Mobilisation nuclease domain